MLTEIKSKSFSNGTVYCLKTDDGYLIETTDTFLPYYTKDAIGRKQNKLDNYEMGSRLDRWMIGVSVMSGCPVRCKFCATGQMKKYRNLTAREIVDQVIFILKKNPEFDPKNSKEFKINMTRMGEPYLNLDEVKKAIKTLRLSFSNIHCFISTIGIKGSDFSWIEGNITLQISLHSMNEIRRNELIPYKNKMTIEELGNIRTNSNLKTTLNCTLVDSDDWDIEVLKKNFNKDKFFIKLSPINPNEVSDKNNLGNGLIKEINLL